MKVTSNNLQITVVTVVFNCKDEIENTILSVLQQTYNNIEYVIVDGGSVDGTLDIIERYRNNIDKYISEPDGGVFYAMNKGLNIADGDFILFMNGGDTFCTETTIENMVASIHSTDQVYYGNAIFVDKIINTKTPRAGVFTKYRLAEINLCHQTIFYPKKIYKANLYDTDYKLYADWVYNMKLFLKTKFIYINQNIAYYDANGLTANNEDSLFRTNRMRLIYKFLGIDTILYLVLNKIKKVAMGSFKINNQEA